MKDCGCIRGTVECVNHPAVPHPWALSVAYKARLRAETNLDRLERELRTGLRGPTSTLALAFIEGYEYRKAVEHEG